MYTSGGRGGAVYEVTTLEDSGPGSLRDAVGRPNRTIVFRVSGTIELQSTLMLDAPNITIAGQTAPGDGICLKNYALRVNAKNVIVRYLRVRPGDQGNDPQVDGISRGPRGGSELIFDHCSATWAIDENFSVYGLPNTTVQWCIIGEGLADSKHPKGAHGMGGILNGYDTSIHHNLFVSNNDRNPKFDVGDWWPGKNSDFRNNVVYNWGFRATWGGNGGNTLTNVIGNYYKPGPATRSPEVFLVLAGGPPGEWFVEGNVLEGFDAISRDNWRGIANTNKAPLLNAIRRNTPVPAAPITTQTAKAALMAILAHAGASLPSRDQVDQRLVDSVAHGTGQLIDSPAQVGGWPVLQNRAAPADTDHDGMPDHWESVHGLNPGDPADRNLAAPGGYTHLELYLNSLVPKPDIQTPVTRPAEAYWPRPRDGASRTDNSPRLRWKAGFNTKRERVYFGDTAQLGARHLKAEHEYSCQYIDKQEISSSSYSPGFLARDITYYWRVDTVNEEGVTQGPVWSFTPAAPAPAAAGSRIEAEAMTLEECVVEKNSAASQGTLVSVPTGTGVLRFAFAGQTGRYSLVLCHVDESDGAGEISLEIDGSQVARWRAEQNDDQFVRREIKDLALNPGAIVKITSTRHRDELGRIDYLEIVPAGREKQESTGRH